MQVQAVVAAVTSAVLIVLALWHVYWAFGGRLAHAAALPIKDGKPLFRPSAPGTFAVALALFGFAWLAAFNGGLLGTSAPSRWLQWAGAAVALAMLGRAIGDFRYVGFFKRMGGEPFASLDSRVYSPLCLLLSAGMASASWPA